MEDERLNNILAERDKSLAESNSTYDTILNNNQNLYNLQQNYANDYETNQNDIARMNYEQNERLINQQKEKAQRETDIENKKAYNSYLKANNQYGTDVEKLGGLNNSGYSETYKMGTYNTYQNRVGRANAALRDAFTQYDNEMYDAKKNYDVTKAQNALNKLQMQIDYATNFNSNNNNALMNKLNSNESIKQDYRTAYQNERDLQEKIRQYNENMAYQKERDKIADQQWQSEYNLSRYNTYNKGSGTTKTTGTDALGNSIKTQQAENYYFKKADGTYTDQPSYINDVRLVTKDVTAGEIGANYPGIGKNYRIWQAGGNYYVWNNNEKTYYDVTDLYKAAKK